MFKLPTKSPTGRIIRPVHLSNNRTGRKMHLYLKDPGDRTAPCCYLHPRSVFASFLNIVQTLQRREVCVCVLSDRLPPLMFVEG